MLVQKASRFQLFYRWAKEERNKELLSMSHIDIFQPHVGASSWRIVLGTNSIPVIWPRAHPQPISRSFLLMPARDPTQTRRHAFIASLLGVPRFIVAINKMDLVGFSEEVFRKIESDFIEFSKRLTVKELRFIPVSAMCGDNIVNCKYR